MASSVACRGFIEGVNLKKNASTCLDTQLKVQGRLLQGGNKQVSFGAHGACHRKTPGCGIRSVLDNPSKKSGSLGDSGTPDAAIAALERLFQQAQFHEDRSADPNYAAETGLELTVSELEVDLTTALNALKAKEEELRAAEQAVKADQEEVQVARSALLHREKDLEAAYSSQSSKRDELERVHQELVLRKGELLNTEQVLKEREADLYHSQEALSKQHEDLSVLRALVLEKEGMLKEAASTIRLKELELAQATSLLCKQTTEKDALRAAVLERDLELKKLVEERQEKKETLERIEAELETRTNEWLSVQKDLKVLEHDLASRSVRGKVRETEYLQIKSLLTEVQAELEGSQLSAAKLRQSVGEQSKLLEAQHKDLVSQKTMLALYEENLTSARLELKKNQEQIGLARQTYDSACGQLEQEKSLVVDLQLSLLKEKGLVEELTVEVYNLKREVQERDLALSDMELTLQVKEAELVGMKLELQHVKSELSFVKLELSQKDIELQAARRSVQALQEEVMHVKGLLQSKEEQLSKVTLLLRRKEDEVASLRVDLNDTNAQLNQATSVVQRITELSRSLVGATLQPDIFNEESMLLQKNTELFATKRALFESQIELGRLKELQMSDNVGHEEIEVELQALRMELQEKDQQLWEVQAALESRDNELKQLLLRWDAREHELTRMRDEVSVEAKALQNLRTTQLQGFNPDTATQLLQGERAKLEAEAAVDALRSLTKLSHNLVEKCLSSTKSETIEVGGKLVNVELGLTAVSEKGGGLQDLKARLSEKDAALQITKGAMENLTNLTKRLMKEAGFQRFNGHGIAPAGA